MYVLTSGQLIVSFQIHSKKKAFKGVKMTAAKWTIITEEKQDMCIMMQDLMKRGVCWCGVGDAPRSLAFCSFQVLYSSSPKSHS